MFGRVAQHGRQARLGAKLRQADALARPRDQGPREGVEEIDVDGRLARPEHHAAEEAKANDSPRQRQSRRDPGPDERRLARSAGARHEQEGLSALGVARQLRERGADLLRAAEEDRGVLEVEMLQAAKRRCRP